MNQQQPFEHLPRRVYFGAADKAHLADRKISGGTDIQTIEVSRRQKLAATLIQRAEDVAAAVKTMRAFDATGNTEHALDHLQATLQDLTKAHGLFVDDVTDSIARYRDRRDNQQVIAESAPARPAAGLLPEADRDAFRAEVAEYYKVDPAVVGPEVADIPVIPGGNLFTDGPKPGPRA